MPKNIDEAVLVVMDAMSADQMEHLRQLPEVNLANEHFGLGLWIRNLLGHWIPPIEGEEYPDAHPDDVSSKITELVWQKLQQGINGL
jgi:hypothetical protein